MEPEEIKEQTEQIVEGEKVSPFNKAIAVAVVFCAVFMAISKVKDDNIVQAMQQAQAERIDQWNLYQAKSLKGHVYDVQIEQWTLQGKLSPPANPAAKEALDGQIAKWKAASKKYEDDKAAAMTEAKKQAKMYDDLNYRDDQFDLSDTLLGLAVALFALASLVRSRWVFGIATASAGCGIIMGLAGFLQWHIHPDWIIKYLS